MFDGPEYTNYIELCRELRLERDPFQIGDWLWDGWAKEPHCQISFAKLHAPPSRDVFWLPRLDQWLAMLEEAGIRDVGFWVGDDYAKCGVLITYPYELHYGDLETAPTREEAAARLWKAVVDEIALREGVTSY